MKTLRMICLVTVALVSAKQARAVMYIARPYEPNMARWLTRDPIGEDGGANLYGFVVNDPVNCIDPTGLAELEYWSEGRVHYNGPGEYTRGITTQVTRDASESGMQSSPDAYIYQSVFEIRGCTGGICNSGGDDKQSSFVRARVKNVSKCPLTLDCQCSVHWFLSNFTPGPTERRGPWRGMWISGTVLEHSFLKYYRPKRQPDGSWLALGVDTFPQRKVFPLAAGASHELYYVVDHNNTSAPEVPGAGFTESMSGDCSCTVTR